MPLERDGIHTGERFHMNNAVTPGQIIKLLQLLEERGMTSNRFQAVFGSGILSDVLEPGANLSTRREVRRALKLCPLEHIPVVGASTHICVNYSQSLQTMLDEAHCVLADGIDPALIVFCDTDYERSSWSVKPLTFGGNLSSEFVIRQIREENGWVSAGIEQMLALLAKYPEDPLVRPIVAFGSQFNHAGDRYVPVAWQIPNNQRKISLEKLNRNWPGEYHYLAGSIHMSTSKAKKK